MSGGIHRWASPRLLSHHPSGPKQPPAGGGDQKQGVHRHVSHDSPHRSAGSQSQPADIPKGITLNDGSIELGDGAVAGHGGFGIEMIRCRNHGLINQVVPLLLDRHRGEPTALLEIKSGR